MTKGTWPLSTADALPQALVELAVLLDECPSDPEEFVVRLHQKVAHGALGQGLRGHLQLASNGPELAFLFGRQLQRDRHTNLWSIILRFRAAAAAVEAEPPRHPGIAVSTPWRLAGRHEKLKLAVASKRLA